MQRPKLGLCNLIGLVKLKNKQFHCLFVIMY
jgi:hypothetical protein